MPNTNDYHVYVEFSGDEPQETAVAGGGNKGSTQQGQTYGEQTAESLRKGVKGLVSFGAIKNTATDLIGRSFGTIELRTGASEYEQRQQFIFGKVNEGINAAGVIGVGIATGNAPLAIIGVVTGLISQLTDVIFKAHTLQLEQTVENQSLQMATVRAGVNNRR